MKAIVTEKGVLIPPKFLKGIKEVEIRKENNKIVIMPIFIDDPIFQLGKNPIVCNIPDASENHDKYIYGINK